MKDRVLQMLTRTASFVRETWVALAVVAIALIGFVCPQVVLANITIPNTLDVDAFGTSTLATAAPMIISVLTVTITILFVLVVKRVIFRGGAKIPR